MMRDAPAAPAEVQRAAPVSPFQYARPTFGQNFNQAPGRGFPSAFPARPNPLANPTPRPAVNPFARFIFMRANPINNPTTPTEPTTPTAPAPPVEPTAPAPPSTSVTPGDSPSTPIPVTPLPPNVPGVLNTLYLDYAEFIATHPKGSYQPPPDIGVLVVNNQVGVYVNSNGQGDFSSFISSLQEAGMSINASNAGTRMVSGMLPIAELPAVANNPQTLSLTPRYAPVLHSALR